MGEENLLARSNGTGLFFVQGDIHRLKTCRQVFQYVDFILHEAALSSVPGSIADSVLTNENNLTGFLNMLITAGDTRVKQSIYSASSCTWRQDQNGTYAAVIPKWFYSIIQG